LYAAYRFIINAIIKPEMNPIKVDPTKTKLNIAKELVISCDVDTVVLLDFITEVYITIAIASLKMDSPKIIDYRF
jgi:hypothetical protein